MNYDLRYSVQAILARALPSDSKALEELAERLDTSVNLLKVFRSGDCRVPLDRAFKIADALELEPAGFFSACLSQFLDETNYQRFLEAFTGAERNPSSPG